jgi:hypothetical protein
MSTPRCALVAAALFLAVAVAVHDVGVQDCFGGSRPGQGNPQQLPSPQVDLRARGSGPDLDRLMQIERENFGRLSLRSAATVIAEFTHAGGQYS